MVSVTHSIAQAGADAAPLDQLAEGLPEAARDRLARAADYARALYGERLLGSGEAAWPHALGMALVAASLRLDLDTRLAALLFAASDHLDDATPALGLYFREERPTLGDALDSLVEKAGGELPGKVAAKPVRKSARR